MTPVTTTLNKRILPQKCLAQVISRHEDCVCEKEVIQESFCKGRQKSPRYNTLLRGGREYLLLLVCVAGTGLPPKKKRSKAYRIHQTLSFKQLTICCHCRDQVLYLSSTSSALKEPTSTNMHKIIHSSGISKKESLSKTSPSWLALLHAKQPFHQLSSGNSEEKLLVIGERKL